MVTKHEYAQFSSIVYAKTPQNKLPIPDGWVEERPWQSDTLLGFSAGVYKRGGEIVISYTGTNGELFGALDYLVANGPGGLGTFSPQVMAAITLYLQVRDANPGATISFTGHSLGGGLAALMAVYFGKEAITFAPAPFKASANSDATMALYMAGITALGKSDAAFSAYLAAHLVDSDAAYTARQANVEAHTIAGEVLIDVFGRVGTIVNPTRDHFYDAGNSVSNIGLHSMLLHAAVIRSEDFRQVVIAIDSVLPTIKEENLYASNAQFSAELDFMHRLMQQEWSWTGAASTSPLNRFATDLQKITPTTYGMASGNIFAEALVVAAIEYRYFKDAASATQLFTFDSYGLHFKYSDIGASSYKSLPKLAEAVNALLTPEEQALLNGRLIKQDAWHIQSGLGGMIVNGGADNDAMIGGTYSDGLWGGAGNDILVGGANNDVLVGETGSDYLLGGIGFDTYLINPRDGFDTVLDADGLGVIQIAGIEAKGSAGLDPRKWVKLSDDSYADTQNNLSYTKSIVDGETQLLIRKADATVLVKGWSAGELGIALGEGATTPPPAPTLTLTGDHPAIDQDAGTSGIQAGYDANHNLITDYGQAQARQDILYGSAGNDLIRGLSGIDYLDGRDGDDILEGGTEAGVLAGGAGNDLLKGGDGNDILLGDHDLATVDSYNYTKNASLIASITHTPDGQGGLIHNYQLSIGGTASPAVGGADVIDGGLGDDIVFAGGGDDQVDSGDGADVVFGDGGQDVILAGAGNDILVGDNYGQGVPFDDDYVSGGDGNDWLYGTGGNDTLEGGAGNDVLLGDGNGTADDGADVLLGGTGDDTLYGYGQDDVLLGGEGTDYLDGGEGNDVLIGGAGLDTLIGGGGNDTLIDDNPLGEMANLAGGAGDDTYQIEGAGDVNIYDNEGNNTIALAAVDNLEGTTLALDTDQTGYVITLTNGRKLNIQNGLFGTRATLQGGDGSETDLESWVGTTLTTPVTLQLDNAGGRVYGGAGADYLYGGTGNDSLSGALGNDALYGGAGNDALSGGAGADRLEGGAGDDLLDGGAGDDALLGGDGWSAYGNDTYRFGRGYGSDVISDYDDTVGNMDRVVMTADLLPSDVIVTVEKNSINANPGSYDLVLSIAGTNDSLRVWMYFYSNNHKVEAIQFSDGTVWDNGALTNLITVSASTYGADFLYGSVYADEIDGLGGNDEIRGNGGNDVINGGDGNDKLYGGAGDDVMDGGNGNDTLIGESGNDTMAGGTGNDIYVVSDAGDAVSEAVNQGTDEVLSAITYTLGNDIENLSLQNITAINGTGNAVNNILRGNSAANVLDGGLGADTLIGGLGNDTYVVDNAGDIVTETSTLATEIDTVQSSVTHTLSANVENLTLTGAAALSGTGNALNNVLTGNSADNILSGGTGADTLIGGLGNDIYVIENAGDTATEYLNEGWSDTVESSITFTLGENIENLTLIGAAAIDATGNELANTLIGNSAVNILTGGAGNDTYVFGKGSGQDTVNSYDTTVGKLDAVQFDATVTPPDVLVSRLGNDLVLSINGTTDTLTIQQYMDNDGASPYTVESIRFADGTTWTVATILSKLNNRPPVLFTAMPDQTAPQGDTFNYAFASNAFTDPDAGDTLTYSASLADGSVLPSWLSFNAATRTFSGTPSTLGAISVRVTAKDTGNLTVSDTFDITVSVQNLTLNGTSGVDTLNGGAGNDTLNGLAGNDTLNGNAGNDRLDGGTGNDTLRGGTGDDTYIVDSATDVVTENASEGLDIVQASVTTTLAANVENLTLTGTTAINGTGNTLDNTLTGNSANNTLTGGAGNDRIDGGIGNDTMLGGTGNDTYVVNVSTDVITENVNEGTDTVESSVTLTLASNVENLILTGTSAINGTGNTLNNVLTGNSAANTLSGGTGADTMIGGVGNDTYVVDNAADAIVEQVNEGTDLVQSSVTYTLAANAENLTLTGTTAINGTGNVLDNVLTGNSASNTLTGGAGNDRINGGSGNDTMIGGTGNDTYVVNVAIDIVTENANEGTDTVESSVTLTLGNNVENLTLTGTSALNGTGNTLDNVLTGNSANNILTGGAGNDRINGGTGNDTMRGGTGDDTYVVNVATDIVTENANEGTDTVESSVTLTLGNNVENLTLTGTSAVNGTGNTLNNVLTGNSAVNSLSGAAGNDTLEGKGGNDTLTGGTGNDTYLLGRGYASDTVVENDSTAGNIDIAQFMSGVAVDQIWFRQAGNNLEASIIGTSDKLMVKDWYLGTAYHVEQFKTTDGNKTLLDSQVQNLVNAMAAFAPPAAGQTTLPQNYQDALAGVIAANWQ